MANIFQRISNVFQTKEERSTALQASQRQSYLDLGVSNNHDLGQGNAHLLSTVYSCANVLTSTVSKLQPSIFQKNGLKKIELVDHPLFQKLKYNPQSFFNTQQWLSTIESHLVFNGNAYVYNNERTGDLQIIHPHLVGDIREYESEITGNVDLWYYIQTLNKEPAIVRSRDIMHFKTFVKNDYKGVNPVDAIRNEINIQHKAELTVSNFFSKNGNTTKYIESMAVDPKDLTGAKVQEIINNFGEKVSITSQDSIVRVPPLHTLKELSLNVEAVQYLESNKYTASQIGSVFGVPDFMLGINTPSQYGKYEEQAIAFKQGTISGIANMILAEMNFKLLTPSERAAGIIIEFDYSALDSLDTATKISKVVQLKNAGALSPNEARAEFNLPVVDHPAMDGYYSQMQYFDLTKPSTGSTGSNNINYNYTA